MVRACEILRSAREAAGLTQEQLAMRAGIRQSSISNVESAKLEPSYERLASLVWLTGHDLDATIRRRALQVDEAQFLEHMRMLPEERLELTIALSRFAVKTMGLAQQASTDRLLRELDEIAES
ncbi:MAG: helix-turn-helix domain-containing protein [Solirubrobacteraceae bacterium]